MSGDTAGEKDDGAIRATAGNGTCGGVGCADRYRCDVMPAPFRSRNPYQSYGLGGPQVDPEAGNWTRGAKTLPHVVSIHSVLLLTTDPARPELFIPPYPKERDLLDWEIAELAA